MKTEYLLSILPIKRIEGVLPEEVTDLAVNSRAVNAGGIFVCIKGFTVDGHMFAQQAAEQGARVIIASAPVDVDTGRVAVVYVEDTARTIALLAPRFYGSPSKRMKMIGVTGTNGKTTVSNLIHSVFQEVGVKSAATGTIGFNLDGVLYETDNTTTDVLTTQQMISQAANEGCEVMTMEVSSHGLVEGRLSGTEFDIAIFTNLTHDHLDFHGTMENYGNAKGLLFAQLGQDLEKYKYAILNADDPWSDRMKVMTPYPVLTYGIHQDAAFRASEIVYDAAGTRFTLTCPEGTFNVRTNLIGDFNVSNALATIAALAAYGMRTEEIIRHLGNVKSAKGRMEKVETSLPLTIYVDYAHSPDAIEKAISSVLPNKPEDRKLIFLIGTGGNRDRKKRPVMAEKASAADYVILTTDDPRDEPYDTILAELAAGMTHDNYACLGDREEAVKHAIKMAEPGDMIIFAGKGHEDFQIIGSTKYPHSDAEIAIAEAEKKFGKDVLKK